MHSGIIYGIDIAKGSSRAQAIPKYAVAILKEGQVQRHSMVSRSRILKMVKEDKPDFIAVDNIFELAPDKDELIRFLDKLPDPTRLIQVTGGLHQQPLLKLAQEHGISMNQFSPGDEAEACARLAAMSVGCEVSLFEDVTRIKVSRARSLGRGGWSQNRYRRKVHGAVKEKSRLIEQILRKFSKDTGVNFTSKSIEGFGGYVRTEFIVNSNREKIPVHPSINADVQVSIRSVERDKIKYIPLTPSKRKYTIVGIDPGTTVGIAILSLDGDLLFSSSFRGMSHDQVVKLISDHGKPAIVATDVYPTPAAVEKVRRSFKAVLGTPGTELRAEEKIAMARPFGYSNDHERDSLAAAINTYRNYKNIFSRVEKKAPRFADLDLIKYHVINGDPIEEAIEKVTAVRVPVRSEAAPVTGVSIDVDEQVKRLQELLRQKNDIIHELKEYVQELKETNSEKGRRIAEMEGRINKLKQAESRELRKQKEIQIRDTEISRLKIELSRSKQALQDSRQHIGKLKQIRKKEIKGEGLPVKVVSAFTKEAIQQTMDMYGIKKGDVVLLEDSSGGAAGTAAMLVETGIRAVIVKDDISHAASEAFFQGNVPLLKDIDVQRFDDFATVDPKVLEQALSSWQEDAKKKRRDQEHQHLTSLLEEYRSERRRGLA
jgi:predicted RNase H-like nuclease (RuvC/YqgF family)